MNKPAASENHILLATVCSIPTPCCDDKDQLTRLEAAKLKQQLWLQPHEKPTETHLEKVADVEDEPTETESGSSSDEGIADCPSFLHEDESDEENKHRSEISSAVGSIRFYVKGSKRSASFERLPLVRSSSCTMTAFEGHNSVKSIGSSTTEHSEINQDLLKLCHQSEHLSKESRLIRLNTMRKKRLHESQQSQVLPDEDVTEPTETDLTDSFTESSSGGRLSELNLIPTRNEESSNGSGLLQKSRSGKFGTLSSEAAAHEQSSLSRSEVLNSSRRRTRINRHNSSSKFLNTLSQDLDCSNHSASSNIFDVRSKITRHNSSCFPIRHDLDRSSHSVSGHAFEIKSKITRRTSSRARPQQQELDNISNHRTGRSHKLLREERRLDRAKSEVQTIAALRGMLKLSRSQSSGKRMNAAAADPADETTTDITARLRSLAPPDLMRCKSDDGCRAVLGRKKNKRGTSKLVRSSSSRNSNPDACTTGTDVAPTKLKRKISRKCSRRNKVSDESHVIDQKKYISSKLNNNKVGELRNRISRTRSSSVSRSRCVARSKSMNTMNRQKD